MPDSVKRILNVCLVVLTSAVTVLLLIPGEQGESVLRVIIEAIKRLLA